MKRNILALLAAAALVAALASTPASADTCSITGVTGTGSTIDLNFNNMGLAGLVVTFCMVDNGTNTFFQFSGITNGETSGLFSIQEFGLNGTDTFVGATDPDGKQNPGITHWKDAGTKTMDGFGSFADVASATDSPDTDTILEFLDGDTAPTEFAAHIKFNDGCTGFVSNVEGNGSNDNNAGCSNGVVPEPSSLMLFGTGLLGIAGFLRRKLLS